MENSSQTLSGITIAGNILVDVVNLIDKYPPKNMLANIRCSANAVGGCVCNTIIDLAKIDPFIKLTAIGKVGDDNYGHYAINTMKKHGIDIDKIIISDKLATSYTQVMTEKQSGDRTFFCYSGANSDFGINDIDVDSLSCKFFHIGYILLLDKLDEADDTFGTKMSRLLHSVQKRGIKTSIDVVSEDRERFSEKVIPALKYCDFVIINEIECCRIAGKSARNADGSLSINNIRESMKVLFNCGVREKVIVHCPEAGFIMNKEREVHIIPSLVLPDNFIKGSVGAGDAYAAACLYGLYNDFSDEKTLEFASCAAAMSLSSPDSISGMKSAEEIEKMNLKYERKPFNEQGV